MQSPEFIKRAQIAAGVLIFSLGTVAGGAVVESRTNNHSSPSVSELIASIDHSETALVFSGIKKCPQLTGAQTFGVFEIPRNSVAADTIIQTYVGDPKATLPNGNSATLFAAHVDRMYQGADGGAVLCGTDNHANGAPFDGIMMASANAPGLIITLADKVQHT